MNSKRYDSYLINTECVVITPNQKLAFHLNQLHSFNNYRDSSKSFCLQPRIFSLNAWLQSLWLENLADTRTLVSETQEHFIWEQIIHTDLGEGYQHLVAAIQKTWKIINQYLVPLTYDKTISTVDCYKYASLAKQFKKYCQNHKLLTQAELLSEIAQALKMGRLSIPKKIQFIGFEKFYPQLELFLHTAAKSGTEYFLINPNCQYSNIQLIDFPETSTEILTAASWCKTKHEEHPAALIGLVVANLEQLREKIARTFTQILDNDKLWHIALGKPIASFPICQTMFAALELAQPLTLKTFNTLLLSPYLKSATMSQSQRILLEIKLRKLNNAGLLQQAFGNDVTSLGLPKELVDGINLFLSAQNQQKTYYEWAKVFSQMLTTMGWPGELTLDSTEYKIVEHCNKLLQEFSALGNFQGKSNYFDALAKLRWMAEHTLFQAKNVAAPINILGILEASGINFDYLWVMGMDDASWPTSTHPSPYIPYQIQKQYNLPQATAANELQFCETLTQRLIHSAQEIIFSYSKVIADGEERGPSPLLTNLPLYSHQIFVPTPTAVSYFEQQLYEATCETIFDITATPLAPEEIVTGGSSLLELQSLCPFRACAEFRMDANAAFASNFSLRKTARGKIVHHALELFWHQVQSHEQLHSLSSSGDTASILAACIDQAIANFPAPPVLQELERICITKLLEKWLNYEKNREPFWVVATEKTTNIKLKNLKLTLRLDRIDQTLDGTQILIDYKTGKILPSIACWFIERPYNLQLPLYCLTLDNISGIAYVKINSRGHSMKLITLDDVQRLYPEIDSWAKLTAYWQQILARLAEDFINGAASVAPANNEICRNCHLKILCRIRTSEL